jgi:hypothetical protein
MKKLSNLFKGIRVGLEKFIGIFHPFNERSSKIRWNFDLLYVFFIEKRKKLDNASNYNIINETRGNEVNLGKYIFIGIKVFMISILKSYKNLR